MKQLYYCPSRPGSRYLTACDMQMASESLITLRIILISDSKDIQIDGSLCSVLYLV